MKKNIFSMSPIAAVCTAAVLMLTFASCDNIVEFNDGYTAEDKIPNIGAPEIKAVYNIGDTALTTPVTQAEIGTMVRIEGKNLNNVQSVKFNTVAVDLKEAYTASTYANVRVPETLSFETVNKIEYVTDRGTALYDFIVPFPTLAVNGVENEFVNAGDYITVSGANFDVYDFGTQSKALVNGVETTVSDVTKSSMKVLVPQGTPDNSTVTLCWQSSDGVQKTAELPFRPTSNLLYGDFEGVSMNVDGAVKVAVEGDDATSTASSSLGHKHLHFTGDFSAWAWNTVDLSCNMIDIGSVINVDDYVLKFEVLNTKDHPLTETTGLKFCFNWGSDWAWNPADGAGINTFGDWQTVSLPLAGMATNGISDANTWQTLRLILQPSAAYNADFCIGNIRIVKK
jgi:hypothetical protein